MFHLFALKIQNLKFICYPDSGIYVYTADNLHLVICATPLGQNNSGGHTHNDKLSYELWMDGKDIVRDPGSYLYTSLPNRRNEFRSIKAHNVPIVRGVEQNSWGEGSIGLFGMFRNSECFVSDFNDDFIELVLRYKGIIVMRRFEIKENGVTIKDNSNKEFGYYIFKYYSNGYGKIMRSQ